MGKKTVIKIETMPLQITEVQKEIDRNNLGFTLRRLREMLSFVNNLSVSSYDVVEIVKCLPDKNPYFFERLSECYRIVPDYDWIDAIRFAINEIDVLGYGKPEKFNQPYYLIVKCAINLIIFLGY